LGRIPGRCSVAGRRQYGSEQCADEFGAVTRGGGVMTKRAWAITGLAVGMFALVGLTAAVVVWRIGFGVSAPSANDRIAHAVTPTVQNRFGYRDVSCSLVGSTDRLFKCAANGQSIGLFLLESDGVVDRVSSR
jgi:hypothetical protein